MIKFGYRTDKGMMRQENQDALLLLPKRGIYVVCDGVGGRQGGEIASRKAVNCIEKYTDLHPLKESDSIEASFIDCFCQINADIADYAADHKDTEGMATTAVVAYVDGDSLCVINIGDSRAYLIRDDEIMQITEDHTYVNALVRAGSLTKEEAQTHPQKNIITKALGAAEDTEPDFFRLQLAVGDTVLLCSDGLSGELSDDEIRDIVLTGKNENAICKSLVKTANEHGGSDNITVIVLSVYR